VTHAAITGWGKCLPPAVLSNTDLATLFDTSDEWITTRTGIRERRISHVGIEEMAYVASMRALACAGVDGGTIDLVIFGTCSHDDQVPNQASGVQLRIGAHNAASMDVNTACTSFLYGLSTATAMIRTGVVRNALVIGAELISPFMDWKDRNVAVLFGDGAAAVVLEATDRTEGLLAEKLGCYGDAREILRVQGMGGRYANRGALYGATRWQFEGQEIFKRAVHGMGTACESALAKLSVTADQVDLVVPHQANLRIIEAVAKRVHTPMERVFVNVHR
jgi:3-oxoacyl-[acyl-carrier-protein] synthase III